MTTPVEAAVQQQRINQPSTPQQPWNSEPVTLMEKFSEVLDATSVDSSDERIVGDVAFEPRRRAPTPHTSNHDLSKEDDDGLKKVSKHRIHEAASSSWLVVAYEALPEWMQDNDFLISSYRPPMPSSNLCFRSIFRLHTETLNIWTHLLGAASFVFVAAAFFLRSQEVYDFAEFLVFLLFFGATILCMSLSWLFHTMACHSFAVSSFFVKLDYLGIAVLIVGSFVPWLYFGFYCSFSAKCCYLITIFVLGVIVVVVSARDEFSLPQLRPVRACAFLTLGAFGVVPTLHYALSQGIITAFTQGSLGWLLLMAFFFLLGASLYALRIPERFFPGKCDIVFQSHQIFHVCVVLGCYVQFHGICQLKEYMHATATCGMP